jgi:D-serine deaminase-like pyridoxal phosphate-dependent protein
VVDNTANVADLGREAAADGVVDIDVGNRRTGIAPGEPALALARAVAAQPALRFRGLQGYAGHCAHVIGWGAREAASRAALAALMETRALIEHARLPGDIVAGGSTGTWDIDVELPGLTELQADPIA